MNIQCPKCQFSQPKDQYCAQCGVDISRYIQKPSAKLKTLLINSSVPVSLIIIGIVTFNYTTKSECPPLCENNNPISAARSTKNIIKLKKALNTNNQNHASQDTKTIKSKIKINRKVSSVKKKILNAVSKTTPPIKTPSSPQKIDFKIDAQLVRFSKNLTNFIQESSSLKFFSIDDEVLKNILLENTEVLNDFSEQNIKKAVSNLPSLALTSRGLKLIVLNGHTKPSKKKKKLFFEALNLDLEALENNKDSQSFIAILINVH